MSFQKSLNQLEMGLFNKMIQIYNLIWNQLGKRDEAVPLTFLNQMFILMRLFLAKLVENLKQLVEINLDECLMNYQTNRTDDSEITGKSKLKECIVELFRVNKDLVRSLKKHELNLVKPEENSLNEQLKMCSREEELDFNSVLSTIQRKRRLNSISETMNNSIKKIRF